MVTTLPYGTAGEVTLPCGHAARITGWQTHIPCPVCRSGRGIFLIIRRMPTINHGPREPQATSSVAL